MLKGEENSGNLFEFISNF